MSEVSGLSGMNVKTEPITQELISKLEILEGHNSHLSILSDRLAGALNRLRESDPTRPEKSEEDNAVSAGNFLDRLDNDLTKTATLCNELEASVSELERLI